MKTLEFHKEVIKKTVVELFDDTGEAPKWLPSNYDLNQWEELNTVLLQPGANFKKDIWFYFIHQNNSGYHFLYRYKVIE